MKYLAYVDEISGFTALPGINNKMSQGLLDGIYWVPQMVSTLSETSCSLEASSTGNDLEIKDTVNAIELVDSLFLPKAMNADFVDRRIWYRLQSITPPENQLTNARFHCIRNALYARNAIKMVQAGRESARMAHWTLECKHMVGTTF